MEIHNYREVKAEDVAEKGASHVKVHWLITKEMGAPNFAMRLFEVEPEGYSPLHAHPWEHEVFVFEGEGAVFGGIAEKPFKVGDSIYVAPNERHQFRNTGKKLLRFLCLVPHKK